MDEEIRLEFDKVKDKLSEEEFLEKIRETKQGYGDTDVELDFMSDLDIARLIVGQYVDEKNEPLSIENPDEYDKLNNLIVGNDRANVCGRIMKMTNPTPFKSKRPKSRGGKLANVIINDGTAEIRAVFWTENIKLLDGINEGDLIQLKPVTVKEGFRGGTEIQLQRTTKLTKLESLPGAPEYVEDEIIPIAELTPNDEVNIIARITKVQGVRTYIDKNGNEEYVASIELRDASGKAQYTFWRKDTELIESLGLKEGDTIKVLGARTNERNGEINLSHPWMGRIIKGDFDVPEFEKEIRKIGDVGDAKDVNLIGLVTKIQDTITFQRQDGTNGYVKSIEIMDDTGSIKVTLWGEDTKLPINKGDILSITGGDMEFDEYATSGYRLNTNWNTGITINPEDIDTELEYDLIQFREQLQPMSLEQVAQLEDDEGVEVDVLARIITLYDEREFQRDDGTTAVVKSGDISDGTEVLRISLWDEKANTILKLGDAIKIENARVKFDMYSINLNIGKTARIIPASEDEERLLPTFETLEEMLYTKRTIDELDEDQERVRLIARVLSMGDINEFQRNDGTMGKVKSMTLADATGAIDCSLWEDNAEKVFDEGVVLKIENPRITYRNDELNLSIGNSTKIMDASDEESIDLPSLEELEDLVYQRKLIEDLTEDDVNVKISGEIINPRGGRLIYWKCPHCNNTIDRDSDICEFCNEEIETPRPLLVLPARIVDESDMDIGVTFFGKHAEQVLDMTIDEIIEIIDKTGDEGALEDKVEELNGREIELIGYARFNDMDEESITLGVKKILKILL